MKLFQSGILEPVPTAARYLTFSLNLGAQPGAVLQTLASQTDGNRLVVGLGKSTLRAVGGSVELLSDFPIFAEAEVDVPSTPAALWCWLRDDDRGNLIHRSQLLCELLHDSFECTDIIDSFKYGSGRDLTGYEDGTENPDGDEALAAAFLQNAPAGLDGSSFVAVQTWIHDLPRFRSMPPKEQDETIGRQVSDNEELENPPPSAHTKRTEQESFSPEAFLLRRSMPWTDSESEGLNFVAFGKDFCAFDAQLKRMVGAEDGIADALFKFTTPVSGSYFWCPPMRDGKLDLQLLSL